jgi:hypothetical protein
VKPLRDFAGGPSGSDAFVAANPIYWLTDHDPLLILLLHGTNDAIVPFSSSESFFEKYSGQKKLYPILNGSHLDSLGFALDDHTAEVVDLLAARIIACHDHPKGFSIPQSFTNAETIFHFMLPFVGAVAE